MGRLIHSLEVPVMAGRMGLCPCPGRERSLIVDVETLRDWGAHGLVSLMEDHEFAMLGVQSLPERVEVLGMRWWHLPIRDMQIPDEDFETRWVKVGRELRGLLAEGRSIALHCRGGLGRTGTIAARILVEMGTEPETAIALVREVRQGAIETRAQESFIRACRVIP